MECDGGYTVQFPSFRGETREGLPAPALIPATVMLSISPPKSAMCLRTHSKATLWSRSPLLALYPALRSSSEVKNPNGPRR